MHLLPANRQETRLQYVRAFYSSAHRNWIFCWCRRAFWEMLNWEAAETIVAGRVVSSDVVRALRTLPEDGNVMPKHVGDTIHN
jgi:hypothetical protein